MDIHHLIVVVGEQDTEAGLAYLVEGPGAPAMVLIISWATAKAATQGMMLIQMCTAWSITASGCTLSIRGRSHKEIPVPSGGYIIPAFSSSWEMDDPAAVSFFHDLARAHGYFLLLPAVNKMPGAGEPVPCYLG